MHFLYIHPRAVSIFLASLAVGLGFNAHGQLPVGPVGLPAQTFDVAPGATEWSTRSVGPVAAGGAISSAAQLDSAIQTNSASNINVPLPTSSTVPPAANGYAQWNATGAYLQSRANTNWYTLLMATLQNNTGSNVVSVTINYDFATVVAAGANVLEQIPGHRVYYSFTGATGSWMHIPEFDSPDAMNSGPKSATIDVGSWPAGATLFFLWADANASGPASLEGGYTIDNVSVSVIPEQLGPPVISRQPGSQTTGFPNQVFFNVTALGSAPLFYQWFKGNVPVAGATNSGYALNNATKDDEGTYLVTVSNVLGSTTSSNAILTITCSAETQVTITNQPNGQSLNAGATINLSVGADGSAPIAYQWYRGETPIPGATGATYTKSNAQGTDSGFYHVVVANCSGAVTSSVALVLVAELPFTLIGLTNQFWRYDQSGADPGSAWKEAGFDDSSWPSGRGILAMENNGTIAPLINTVLSLTTTGGAPIVTYYFRAAFVVTNDPGSVSITASNYFDDGAVVYVNGTEAFRYNMPNGIPTNTTLAIAANPMGEGVPILSNIPPDLIVQGTNFVAVEVHQNSLTGSDVVFGVALLAKNIPPGVPVIATQPVSATVFDGQNVTLSPTLAVGSGSVFQWLKNGVALPPQPTTQLAIPNASVADAGAYQLVVSNSYGMITSGVATVNVIGGDSRLALLEFTNVWRFNQSGADLGTAWRTPSYDDSTWQSGPGVLAGPVNGSLPEPVNPVLSLVSTSGSHVITYYFRTHFNLPAGVTNVALLASNLVDDGAVFYVNGVEVTRLRVNGPVTASTLAENSDGQGLFYETLLFTPTNLVEGDNVLAVEVHQGSTVSSDVVFGMNLRGYGAFNQPVAITAPLPSQTVPEGAAIQLTAHVIGARTLTFQWFRNGTPLPDETNMTLHIAAMHGTNTGGYSFIAGNALNSATSSVATLSMTADLVSPNVIAAFGTNGSTGVMVVFSEPVLPASATNVANYSLSPGVNILGAQLVANDRVLLLTDGLNVQNSYILTVAGILDTADSPNVLASAAVHVQPNRLFTATGLLQVQTVFMILMENQSWPNIKGSTNCPYINSLLPSASYCENYTSHDNAHPSEPNYIWLEAGDDFGHQDDSGPLTDRVASTNHLSTLLFNAGIEWRGYMEDLPYGSVGVADALPYLARHNPFAFFDDVTTNYDYCTNHVRPYAEFAGDLAAGRIGRYNFITPNITNDMHSFAPGSTSLVRQGDDWLARELPLILNSAAFSNNGAVFITFDENDYSPDTAIPMIVLSPLAKGGGYASTVHYDHSSTLRTMQEIFGVRPLLGDAANATPLNDLFRSLTLRPFPTNGSVAIRIDDPLPGRTNYVQASSDLLHWTSINTNVATNTITIVDPQPPMAGQRFYRVVEQP